MAKIEAESHLKSESRISAEGRVDRHSLRLIVVTPEATVLDELVDFVALPLFDGEIGIAPGRSPLIGRLGYGELRLVAGGQTRRFYIDAGFVQVANNEVSVLTNRAVPAASIDPAVAQEHNGAGIARDAAGRGLSVLLCEQDDLAAHTSSASTKLIHGGLRYLEYYEFALVRKSLQEREVLLRAAPHIIRPLTFVMPHNAGLRPAWMIRAGLFLYDHLGKRELLPASEGIDLRTHAAGQPLKPEFTKGFMYADAWVEDARLVVLNALDAAERGATILTRTRCISARRYADMWDVTLQPAGDHPPMVVRCRVLVNASGPWVTKVLDQVLGKQSQRHLRLAKGSHIIVKRMFEPVRSPPRHPPPASAD